MRVVFVFITVTDRHHPYNPPQKSVVADPVCDGSLRTGEKQKTKNRPGEQTERQKDSESQNV